MNVNKKSSQFTLVTETDETTLIPLIQGNPLGNRIITPANLLSSIGSIPEAPNDGDQYGRQNKTWTKIITSAGDVTKAYVDQQDALKVDKVTGKSLIDDIKISKLDGIEAGAQVNAANTVVDADYANVKAKAESAIQTETDPVWLAEKSGYSQIGHIHDDRYYTESETDTLLSDKSDTSHLHTGVYSSLSMNVLIAGVGATEYTLLRNIQTNILNNLPSGVNSTITLPVAVAGELNESVLHFTTGAVIPTLVYNGFTPVWQGGNTLTLAINKAYTIVFEQVRTNTGTWIVKTSWGEY